MELGVGAAHKETNKEKLADEFFMYLEETVASKDADPPMKKDADLSQPWADASFDTDSLDLFGKVSQFIDFFSYGILWRRGFIISH